MITRTLSKQQRKWKAEIADLKNKIPEWEALLKEHQDKLKNDTTIDFYEIQRRNEGGKRLITMINNAKKRINLLSEKI